MRPPRAGCGGCDRVWSGNAQAHCSTCHEHFGSDSAADRHSEGRYDVPRGHPDERRCIPVERFGELIGKAQKPRLVLTQRADGPVWVTALRSRATIAKRRSAA